MNELDALYQVASDYQADVLDELRRKAGQIWDHIGCWTNVSTETVCGKCGRSYADIPEDDVLGAPRG